MTSFKMISLQKKGWILMSDYMVDVYQDREKGVYDIKYVLNGMILYFKLFLYVFILHSTNTINISSFDFVIIYGS